MKLYRKRFEPKECVLLEKDEIIYFDKSFICTKWSTLKPRNDFNNGCSIYDLEHGVKVSKFKKDDEVIYYYIDIVALDYEEEDDSYVFTDYVLDIVLETDLKTYKVLDEDELDELVEKGIINSVEVAETYAKLEFMKSCIKYGDFNKYLKIFDDMGI